MSQDATTLAVTDNPEANRFEAHDGEELVGVIEYSAMPGKIIAMHTEVVPEREGQGIGSRLVAGMLEQLRADGRQLQPVCPYVRSYLARHAEWSDVVVPTTPS